MTTTAHDAPWHCPRCKTAVGKLTSLEPNNARAYYTCACEGGRPAFPLFRVNKKKPQR